MAGKCPNHPGTQLRFQCSSCGQSLCSRCVTRRRMGTVLMSTCPDCAVSVDPLAPGEVPLSAIAVDALFEPFRGVSPFLRLLAGAGLCTLLSIVAHYTEIRAIDYSAYALVGFLYVCFVAVTVKSSIDGVSEIPSPNLLANIIDDVIAPALFFVGALAFSFVPLIIVGSLSSVLTDSSLLLTTSWQEQPFTLERGLMIFVLIYAVFFAPMAIPITLYTKHLLNATNPILIVKMILKIRFGYLSALIMMGTSLFIILGTGSFLFEVIEDAGNPLYSAHLVGWWFAFYGGFVFATIEGGMLFTYSQELKLRIRPRVTRPPLFDEMSTYPPLYSPPPTIREQTPSRSAPEKDKSRTRHAVRVVPISYQPDHASMEGQSTPSLSEDRINRSSPPPPSPPYDLISMPPKKKSSIPPRHTIEPDAPVKKTAQPLTIEEISRKYRKKLKETPSFALAPDLQWALASHLERSGKWEEAIEAYIKLGNQPLKHPRGADGLLRASYLIYSKFNDKERTTSLLLQLIDKFPEHASAQKGIKVLSALSRQSSP